MSYENACEFLIKAGDEGGLDGLVLGYGVGEDEVPEQVAVAIDDLVSAYDDLQKAVRIWHGDDCVKQQHWDCPGL